MQRRETSMSARSLQKSYVQVPISPRLTQVQKIQRALVGSVLSPAYWLLAHRYRVPGLQFRIFCALLGLRLLCSRQAPVSYTTIYHLLYWPMDSTRYFEFDFMWRALSNVPIRCYLDISSPRLFPIVLLHKRRELTAELLNPDTKDLAATATLVNGLGLKERCHLHDCFIGSVPFAAESFDVITSISVIEHIPEDTQAIEIMWNLLKPGGRLLLTMPCASEAFEQHIDTYFHRLPVSKDHNGYIFLQRFYDQSLLETNIYTITGKPERYSIYGEKQAGFFRTNVERKWSDPNYPCWQEPYIMGKQYSYFDSIFDLPGEGVIGMEFIKK